MAVVERETDNRREVWSCGCGFEYLQWNGEWLLLGEEYCPYAHRVLNQAANGESLEFVPDKIRRHAYAKLLMIHRAKREVTLEY